jgi:ABC-type sugar transport system ATPase subunit
VLDIADCVTVLRDGANVATRDTAGLTIDELAELMIGRPGAEATRPASGRVPQPATDTGFAITYRAGDIESRMEIRPGEIVGVSGLVGAGRTTFAKALTGNPAPTAGVSVMREGRALRLSTPREARRSGIVYLTEDRKRDGLFAELDIVANTTASALQALGRGPLRDGRREAREASAMLKRLRLVASSLRSQAVKLSGGNQQKVLIARALLTRPRLLVCDEPTRGVDVGAKAEIHAILRELTSDGVAVLVVSSEAEELLALAHRIVVMHGRRFVAEMPADQTDESQLLVAASGGATN